MMRFEKQHRFARILLLILSLALLGMLGCFGGGATPGTIHTEPQPTLPGLTQGYVLTDAQLNSGTLSLQTASSPDDFSFILLEPSELLTGECLLGLGETPFTQQRFFTQFGFLYLIDPDVDPYMASAFCGVDILQLSLINGQFTQTISDPEPLIVGENYATLSADIQFDIYNGANYFLLITAPNSLEYAYKLVEPEAHVGPEFSFYVPGLRDLLLASEDVQMRIFRRTSVNILDFIPTEVQILPPAQDPVPTFMPEVTPVYSVIAGSGYHTFSIIQLNPALPSIYNLWDCRFSISGVNSQEILDNAETFVVPYQYDPFDMQFFCSSTLTYEPNLVAQSLPSAPISPVPMEVRGFYTTIPDQAFQNYLQANPYTVFMLITSNTPGDMFPLDFGYIQPDYFHYPQLGVNAPYVFSAGRNLSEQILNNDDIMLHFFRIVNGNQLESIPVSLTVIPCTYDVVNNMQVETCQDP